MFVRWKKSICDATGTAVMVQRNAIAVYGKTEIILSDELGERQNAKVY